MDKCEYDCDVCNDPAISVTHNECQICQHPSEWGLPRTEHAHTGGRTHTHEWGNLPHAHQTVTVAGHPSLANWQQGWGWANG